jgi:hypothetical protein
MVKKPEICVQEPVLPLNYLSTPQWVLSSSKGSNFIKVTKLTNIHGHVHENILYPREVDRKVEEPR